MLWLETARHFTHIFISVAIYVISSSECGLRVHDMHRPFQSEASFFVEFTDSNTCVVMCVYTEPGGLTNSDQYNVS